MPRRFMFVAAMVALTVWSAGMAGAATKWAVQTTPNPSRSASLSGVSCPSATSCTAVGSYFNSSNDEFTLAEHWNGHSWAIQPTPAPSRSASLTGVSCTSATSCTAVGSYSTSASSSDVFTLAEHWNGHSWAIQPTPAPSRSASLSGVSCASATSCAAVGLYANSSGTEVTLAEHWNGHKWAVEVTRNPSGSSDGGLGGVSCVSVTSCTAAGSYTSPAGDVLTLAEHWNGRRWAIQATPNPSRSPESSLSGVSCASATSCTAAGAYSNSAGTVFVTLAEHWNGRRWAIQATPNPSGSPDSGLGGISCTSASCTAAGASTSRSGDGLTLAEHWNGRKWLIEATPNPSRSSSLNGVSCASAAKCTAAGAYTTRSHAELTLAEHS
jgi:hypothetical protein